MEISSLSRISPSIQQEARAQQVGEQRLFEAGFFDTAPVYLDAANGSGTVSEGGMEQENRITLTFSKDRFERLEQECAKAKEVSKTSFIFDGYELHIEYAQRMIDQIYNEFQQKETSPSVIFYGAGLVPQIAEEDPETTDKEAVELEATECEQLPESAEEDEPVLAYMDFEQLMLHGKWSEAMLPNVRQHINNALEQVEQTPAESKQDCLCEVPD